MVKMIKIVMMTVFPKIILAMMMMRRRRKKVIMMIKIRMMMLTVFPEIIVAIIMMMRRRRRKSMMFKMLMKMAMFPEIIVAYNVLTPLPEISHQSSSLYFKILSILYLIFSSSQQRVLNLRNIHNFDIIGQSSSKSPPGM